MRAARRSVCGVVLFALVAVARPVSAQSAQQLLDQGQAAAQRGQQADAVALFTRALALDQTLVPAFRERGLARHLLGDYKGALADFDRIIALTPDDADAFVHRVLFKVALGDARGALPDANRAIFLDPNSANAHFVRAVAEAALGDHSGAVADYSTSLMINPNAESTLNNRALERQALGDYPGALADFRRALEINPTDSRAQRNLNALQLMLGGGAPPPLPPAPSAGRDVVLPPPPPLPPASAPTAAESGRPESAAVRVGGAIKPPVMVRHVEPVYPEAALTSRAQGAVELEATIGGNGKVLRATVLRSVPLLDQAAIDAVRQWEFEPTVINGIPTPVVMTLTVTFTLRRP